MTTQEAIDLVKSNGLTPIPTKYECDGFVNDIGYVGCKEYSDIYLFNGENCGNRNCVNSIDGKVSILYRNKDIFIQTKCTIEYITSSKYALKGMFLDVLHMVNEKIKSNITKPEASAVKAKGEMTAEEIKHWAAEADKAAAIVQAIINGAVAISKTLAVYGWTPAAAPGVIAASVATAAQIAVIQSTPIPQFADGTEFLVGKGTGRSDDNLAWLSHGERVVPAGINSDYFPALSAIQNRDVEPTFANNILTALANGTFDLAAQFQGKQQSTEQGFDYDKLGKVLSRNKSSVNIQMDEAGYTKYLIKENSKVQFRNTKLRLKN